MRAGSIFARGCALFALVVASLSVFVSVAQAQPAPVITGLSPTTCSAAGGTLITITGNNFIQAAFSPGTPPSVTIGGATCKNINITNTVITCNAPAGTPGQQLTGVTIDLGVNNAGQIQASLGGVGCTYANTAAPAVTGVTPNNGPTTGNTQVQIDGTGFTTTTPTQVTIGNSTCTNINVVSDTEITCTVPAAAAAGVANVTVTFANGTTQTLTGGYTYTASATANVSGVTVTCGAAGAAATLAITGTDLNAAAPAGLTAVTVGTATCANLAVTSATAASCTVPTGTAEPANIVLTVNGQNVTSSTQYTCTVTAAAPTVTSVTPNNGPTTGGNTVTINGSGFNATPPTTATIGGNPCTNLTVTSNTTATCAVPNGTAGAANVVVGFASYPSITLTGGYTYTATATVSGIALTCSTTGGANTVTVNGTGFSTAAPEPTSVAVGTAVTCTTAAGSLTIGSATTATCTVPAGTVGPLNIVVTVDGNAALTYANQYTCTGTGATAPTVTGLTPNNGPTAGGNTVTIEGSGFNATPPTTVTIGGATATCTNLTVTSDTTATCTVPVGTAGAANVVVGFASYPSITLTGGYTYTGTVTVTGVSLACGGAGGNTTVTINGTGFSPGPPVVGPTVVAIGGVTCATLTIATPVAPATTSNTATCTVPAGTGGTVNVDVTVNGVGTPITLPGAYTCNAAVVVPTVTSVSPDNGPVAGGNTVTIEGSGFQTSDTPPTSVTFGTGGGTCSTAAGTLTVTSDTAATCIVPGGTVGYANVTVDFATGGPAPITLPNAYVYNAEDISVTGVSASCGSTAGGSTMTITGTGFSATTGPTAVTVGGNACTGLAITAPTPSTTATCTIPAGTAAGAVNVLVSLAGSTIPAIFVNGCTYNAAAQSVTSVTPNNGPIAGGSTVTINGTGFSTANGPTTVTIGGQPCTDLVIQSTTAATCTVPTVTVPGVAAIDVTFGANPPIVVANGYTYTAAATVTGVTPNYGPAGTSTPVTITGSGFETTAPTAVTVNGQTCTGLAVVSDTTATCTVPAQVPPTGGAVTVVVTLAGTPATVITLPAGSFFYNTAAVPACVVSPSVAQDNATVTIICIGDAGDVLTIPNSSCSGGVTITASAAGSTTGNVVCTGTAGALGNNPPLNVVDASGNVAVEDLELKLIALVPTLRDALAIVLGAMLLGLGIVTLRRRVWR